MVEVGETAPAFSLPGSDGHEISEYQLSGFTQSGAVVVLFYPFDFSPVCTEELCEFRDSEWLTFTPDLDIFGISTDSAYAHRRVIQDNELPFPLLSDHDGSISAKYDVLAEEHENHPQVSRRAVFVIDADETIRYAWEADDMLTDPDISEVYSAIRDLDYTDLSQSKPDDQM